MYNLEVPALPHSFRNRTFPLPSRQTPLGRLLFGGLAREGIGTGFRGFRTLEFDALVYLVQGRGLYRDFEGNEQPLATGDFLYVMGDVPHQYGPVNHREWNEIYVCFNGTSFRAWRTMGFIGLSAPVANRLPVSHWLGRMRRLTESTASAPVLVSRTHELIADLFGLGPSAEPSGAWLEQAQQLLATPTPDHPFRLEEVAEACGLGYDTFRKQFRNFTGVSPGDYRTQSLMTHAAEVMRRSAITNERLAEQLGFYDAAHFSKSFKRVHGVSPRDFRRTKVSLLTEPSGRPARRGQE